MWCTLTAAVIVLVVAYYVIEFLLRSLKIDKITDKYVFVTGCDSGFGHLAAIRFDQLGFQVFAGCLTSEGAKSLSESASTRLTTVMLDIGSTESIEQAVQHVKQKLPSDKGLWALINNAGIVGFYAPIELCNRESVLAALNVNLLGTMEMTRCFMPLLRKARGRVVNTTSSGGRLAFIPVPYTVSKHGVEGFSNLLRREMRHQGIKVSIVEPGAFRTPIFSMDKIIRELQKETGRISPDVLAEYGGMNVVKHMREKITGFHQSSSPKLNLVVDAYIHATISKFPRTRYTPGLDATWFYSPLNYLPDCISDFILCHTVM